MRRPSPRRRALVRTLAIQVLVSATGLLPAQSVGMVTTIQLPAGSSAVQEVWHRDLSGDGWPDLVLAVGDEKRGFQRSLRIHTHRGKGQRPPYAQTPDLVVPLPKTVVAGAIGDLHGDAGSELIWFGARGAYVYRRAAPEAQRVVKLVDCEFLFQVPMPREVYSWQRGVRDLDGDGMVDLLLPEAGGYLVAIQRVDASGTRRFELSRLALPLRPPPERQRGPRGPSGSMRKGEVTFRIAIDNRVPKPDLVEVDDTVPAPQLADWDGDGDLDVFARHGDQVLIWTQASGDGLPGGRFSAAPTRRLTFPLAAAKSQLDASFSAWLTDLDGDRHTDAVLLTKDRDADAVRTHVMCFLQTPKDAKAPLFHGGTPQQLLIIGGLTTAPRLGDVDGDGRPDLQVGAWQFDALDQLQGERKLDVEMYVYLNRGGRLSRSPDLTHTVTLDGTALREGSGRRIFARFLGDVTGDGVSELLVRRRNDQLRLYMVRKRDGGLQLIDRRPLQELAIDPEAEVRLLSSAPDKPGFLVLEKSQVLVVTF